MIGFVFRTLGFILLAIAAMFAVIDGTKSIAATHLILTPFGTAWRETYPSLLTTTQHALEGLMPFLWNPVMTTILLIPTSIVIALIAFLFLKLGNLRRRAYL
jgi:hypothetical protein